MNQLIYEILEIFSTEYARRFERKVAIDNILKKENLDSLFNHYPTASNMSQKQKVCATEIYFKHQGKYAYYYPTQTEIFSYIMGNSLSDYNLLFANMTHEEVLTKYDSLKNDKTQQTLDAGAFFKMTVFINEIQKKENVHKLFQFINSMGNAAPVVNSFFKLFQNVIPDNTLIAYYKEILATKELAKTAQQEIQQYIANKLSLKNRTITYELRSLIKKELPIDCQEKIIDIERSINEYINITKQGAHTKDLEDLLQINLPEIVNSFCDIDKSFRELVQDGASPLSMLRESLHAIDSNISAIIHEFNQDKINTFRKSVNSNKLYLQMKT